METPFSTIARHLWLSLSIAALGASAMGATYPNGSFMYSAPPAAALPATPPSGTYNPATMDDVGIQAAINAAANAGGGTVVLASGTYVINNSVVPKTEVWIAGQGRGVSILQRGPNFVYPSGSTDTTNWTGLIYTNITGSVGGITDIEYSNFTIDGNFTTAQLGTIFPNFYGFGIHNDGVGPDYSYRVEEQNLEIKGCAFGTQFTGTEQLTLTGGYYHDNGGGANNIYWHNIYGRRVGYITVTNIYSFNAPGGDGFKFAGGTTYDTNQSKVLTISGSTFDHCGYVSCLLNGVADARLYNNNFTYAAQLMNSNASNGAGVWLATEPDQNSNLVGCSYVDLVNNVIQSSWANGLEIDSSLTNNANISGNLCNASGTNYNIASGGTNVSCDYNTLSGGGVAPASPSGLTATAVSSSQVDLSWSASNGATSYNVLRSGTTGGPYTVIAEGVTATTYSDTAWLAASTTYYYVVQAVGAYGTSGNSNEANVTTLANANPPPPPTGLTATATSGSEIDLSWTVSNGATSYNVLRSMTNGGPYTTIATGVTSTSYSDTGLTAGTTYFYVAQAANSYGTSSDSNQASATTLTVPPAPTNLKATATKAPGKIKLSWTQSTGTNLTNNEVYRSTTNGGPYSLIASLSPTTSYTDTGLSGGTTYYYVVAASNSAGESGYSNQASATSR